MFDLEIGTAVAGEGWGKSEKRNYKLYSVEQTVQRNSIKTVGKDKASMQ